MGRVFSCSLSLNVGYKKVYMYIISTAGAHRIVAGTDFRPSYHPLIAFEHLNLHLPKRLGQSGKDKYISDKHIQ